eukprot:TRINITY_DN23755_c0_g1_i2.p1 TRINITY_DN23755_c0_g1~~TRINITY_DN23755_c0_g1_i2.p1  ORF type:complete len:172 (+),score=43.90 TRINITY_DN23755_c0_g1_i2:52-567(+)
MFEFEDLEDVDPSPIEVNFQIEDEVLSMELPNDSVTPHMICNIWENDWSIRYASRIRFAYSKTSESSSRFLNPRSDVLPSMPAVIRLEGPGSVLTSLQMELRRRGGVAAPAQLPMPDAKKKAAGLGPKQRAMFQKYQGNQRPLGTLRKPEDVHPNGEEWIRIQKEQMNLQR